MIRGWNQSHHVDVRTAVDYLDEQLSPARQRQVELHLAGPCADCRERVRAFGRLIDLLRRDRTPEVPAALRERALSVFVPTAIARTPARPVAILARLLFDSWSSPAPALARRAVGELRRLRFALGEAALELEYETEALGTCVLRGRLTADDPALFRIEVTVGREQISAAPDALGGFLLERVPRGRAEIVVHGPGTRFRLKALTL